MKLVLVILFCFHKVFFLRAQKETSGKRIIEQDDTTSSCSKGWYTFGTMCYKLGGDDKIRRLPWEQAAQTCHNEYEGNLATIGTKEINSMWRISMH
ncbi:hypothetical protein JTE90_029025 [Oedothorax gibbosus]|uniref:C-type lectin domain-containing protein n=1 Tax=Oedothorax gibbosus TaxID=931172 RepID=A0AAV6UJG9_9ARAC|nr:hypothetical protein JTE90_029025 [Oedothorax gibbosus]